MTAQRDHDSHDLLPNVPTRVAQNLVNRIEDGDLADGDLIAEKALIDRYQVSRSSVRSALQELQYKGYLHAVRGRGWRVTRRAPDRSDLADHTLRSDEWDRDFYEDSLELLEVRMSLEPTAASLAAIRARPSEKNQLRRLHHAYREAGWGRIQDLVELDEEFHSTLFVAARNKTLLRLYYDMIVPRVREFRQKSYNETHSKETSEYDHGMIVEAVERGDSILARRTMLTHLWMLYDDVRRSPLINRSRSSLRSESISIFG